MSNNLETLTITRDINSLYPHNESIKQWKERGKKIIGWICGYVPEEIIHAAGMLPVRVTGYHALRGLDDATLHLSTSVCSFSRSCLQLMLDQQLNFMDGFIGGNCCDATRRFSELCILHEFAAPHTDMIDPPARITDGSIALYRKELLDSKKWLENTFRVHISDEALRESIKVHNATRKLLRRLNERRKSDTPPISGSEVLEVLNAGFTMPKEEFNNILEKLLAEIDSTNRVVTGHHRLMISGTPMTNPEFFRMVEELGGLIVAEEMCTGSRYYWELVDENPELDLLDALATRYLRNFPCARMVPSSDRLGKLMEVAREWRVQGVISTIIRFCALYVSDIPMLRDRLTQEGYRLLELNMEYNEGATAQSKTRVQAFLEMLGSQGVAA